MNGKRIGLTTVALMLTGGCGGASSHEALLAAEGALPASWKCQGPSADSAGRLERAQTPESFGERTKEADRAVSGTQRTPPRDAGRSARTAAKRPGIVPGRVGRCCEWHETRVTFRVPNGRPFGLLGKDIATEFVCAGVVHWDRPYTDVEAGLAEVKTRIERQYQTVASKVTEPASAPRAFCVTLSNTVNFWLGYPVFHLQKAYAVLDTGELVSATPAPLYEFHRIRPPGYPVTTYDEQGNAIPPKSPDPALLRWLEPSEPLRKCEDFEVRGGAP